MTRHHYEVLPAPPGHTTLDGSPASWMWCVLRVDDDDGGDQTQVDGGFEKTKDVAEGKAKTVCASYERSDR